MVSYIGMYTRSQKRIKMRMETTICLYNKGNESSLGSCFCVGLCLLLNDNYCYMLCHRQSMLYQICMSWIDNDNIHQGFQTSLVMIISICLCVWQGKRWATSFCTWSPLSDTTIATTFENVSWVAMLHSHIGSITNGYPNHWWYDHITSWKMCNHKVWYTKTDMQCCKEMGWGQMKWKGVKTSQ